MFEMVWVLLILDWTQHPYKEYVLYLLSMGLVSLLRETGDVTKGKRLLHHVSDTPLIKYLKVN